MLPLSLPGGSQVGKKQETKNTKEPWLQGEFSALDN